MKKRIHIIAVMLMVLLLSFALVACAEGEGFSIKGTTDVTINLDKEYAGLKVFSSTANIEEISSKQFIATKNNANIFDVVITCDGFDTQYLTFSTEELSKPVVKNVTMETTTYVVDIKLSGLSDSDIEKVVFSFDDVVVVDSTYDAETKSHRFESKQKWSSLKITCENYFISYNQIEYFNNIANINAEAFVKKEGYAIIIIRNFNNHNFLRFERLANQINGYNDQLESGERKVFTVPIDNYIYSDMYGNSGTIYVDVLQDGFEEIQLENIDKERYILDKIINVDDYQYIYINGMGIDKISIDIDEFEIKEVYCFRENIVENQELVVEFVDINGISSIITYVVTKHDLENKTLNIQHEDSEKAILNEFTFNYVDTNGDKIADNSMLDGFKIIINNQILDNVNCSAVYTIIQNESIYREIRFETAVDSDKYIEDDYYFKKLINQYIYLGKTEIDIVVYEIYDFSVKFVYDDIDGNRKDYSDGMRYNSEHYEADGKLLPKFVNGSTMIYSVPENTERNHVLNLGYEFDPFEEYSGRANIGLPDRIDGLKYDDTTGRYCVELLVFKYYDINISFNYVKDLPDTTYGSITCIMLDNHMKIDSSAIGEKIEIQYSDSRVNYGEVGSIIITEELFRDSVLNGTSIIIDVKISEKTDGGGDGGYDDF